MRHRHAVLAAVVALATLAAACRDRSSEPTARPETPKATAPAATNDGKLTDLGGSLDAIRADFNAHKGEKRFLTLLAPT